MFLNKIISQKKRELDSKKDHLPLDDVFAKIDKLSIRRRDFKKAICDKTDVNIIAEVKKASPSRGILRDPFDPRRLAQQYEFADAAAISVLTDSHFFQGKLEYLKMIREVTARPLLRKDFIIEEYQLYETVLAEADACLLIATILSETELKRFIRILHTYEIEALVEVHTENDLKKALLANAKIIGINNRDLYSFKVDIRQTEKLMRHMPKETIVVSESGIRSYEDIQRLRSIGVHAFLIGESLVIAENPVNALRNLRGEKPL